MQISDQGLAFIKSKEGFKANPYLDSGGKPTIGYGTTYYIDGGDVQLGDPEIDEEEAAGCLSYVCHYIGCRLDNLIEVDLDQYQIDAIFDFCYNLGVDNFSKSTLLKYINDNDFNNASNELLKWCHQEKTVIPGLLNRRKAEKELFLNGIYN